MSPSCKRKPSTRARLAVGEMSISDRDLLATVVQQRDAATAEEQPGVFVLVVTDGPERGRAYRLDGSVPVRALIGTSPACELRVTDREVSRRHAALERIGSTLRITDLGSTNGTWVDRVKAVEADLQGGEMLRVGATMFRVDLEEGDDGTGRSEPALTPAINFGRVVGASRE